MISVGSAPLAPGTTEPHPHCACVELWRHILSGNADASHIVRVWLENTELVSENARLKRRLRLLERRLGLREQAA